MSDYKLLINQCIGKDANGVDEMLPEKLTGGNQLAVYKIENAYCIVKFVDDLVCGTAVFSDEKNLLESHALTPITFELLDTDCFKSYEENYGKWHYEYGSGLCFPAYLTDNFEIIVLYIFNNIISKIEKINILAKTKTTIWTNTLQDSINGGVD